MLAQLEALAFEAGRLILNIRDRGASVVQKGDGSPVTDADQSAEDLIVQGLQKIDSRIPVIAEERIHCGSDVPRLSEQIFFLVDPLDGTKEFIQGRTDFTVNICLVQHGSPQLGVVAAPARNELFSGDGRNAFRCRISPEGGIVERSPIRTRAPCEDLRVVASASHARLETTRFLERFAVGEMLSIGSSLKFCLIAAGDADIYPRIGRTMQWDTAAGDAILRSAGGCTLCLDGQPLIYGTRCASPDAYANPHFVSFAGRAAFLRSMLLNDQDIEDARVFS
jgi:3'(2'), 5'-bisphosphate nucleotidase